MYKRKIGAALSVWADSPYRKTLLLRGARQVGKTTAIRMFSESFDTYIELNLEEDGDRELFEKETDVERLYNYILLSKRIASPGKRVLLFIDEIQNSAKAIHSLRYFYEKKPDLYVVAAGSLLEMYLTKSRIGLAVGRIENLWMHPMDFDEFLEAAGQTALLNAMNEIPCPDYVTRVAREWFMQYALIGGMPEVVKVYLETRDIIQVRNLMKNLLITYSDDMIKYANTSEQAAIIRFVWEHVPLETGKQVSFNLFGGSSYKTHTIKSAMLLLEHSSLLKLVYPYTTCELPALPVKTKKPKLLILDTGLLNYMAGVQDEYFGITNLNSIYKGIAMEHLVGQLLTANISDSFLPLSFWVRDKRGSSAEIDFVLAWERQLIPIEVKAGSSGSLKSMMIYMRESNSDLAIRIYDGEYSLQEITLDTGKKFRLLNLPLTLSCRILEYIETFS
jgi:predicted AAA+ superfamily ATPase